ncbi:hypothetical protein TNCV_917171 [Trichonephila clavipes]|nr:hypothetical protein TNCV_917171 [Trichonephila clavipes]
MSSVTSSFRSCVHRVCGNDPKLGRDTGCNQSCKSAALISEREMLTPRREQKRRESEGGHFDPSEGRRRARGNDAPNLPGSGG